MLIVLTYDVETITAGGQRRLRRVAKTCEDYGQRVQSSVFEIIATPAQLVELKYKLEKIIDAECDSIRYYHMGSNWQGHIESIGKKTSFDPEKDVFIF